MKSCSSVHLNRRARMMSENEYLCVIRRFVTPPALPFGIRPWAANRPEHISSQNPRADPIQAAFCKIIVDTRRAVRSSLHFLKHARWEEPLVQILTSNAQWIVEALIRAGAKPIERYCKTMNTCLRHRPTLFEFSLGPPRTRRRYPSFRFALPPRRSSLSRTISLRSAAGRISNGPAFTPGCFDINWIA